MISIHSPGVDESTLHGREITDAATPHHSQKYKASLPYLLDSGRNAHPRLPCRFASISAAYKK